MKEREEGWTGEVCVCGVDWGDALSGVEGGAREKGGACSSNVVWREGEL